VLDSSAAYGGISLWYADLPDRPLSPLPGERRYDVAIVGGGYTGLWTAYYLKQQSPDLSVCVLEAHACGFGASGRNGGWLMAALEGEVPLIRSVDASRRSSVAAAIHSIIPEVAAVLAAESIDCGFQHGGGIYAAARYPEQLGVQQALLADYRSVGFTEDDARWLDAPALRQRFNIREPLGALYTPHIARVHPAKLVAGLLAAVQRLGVDVFEQTRALSLPPGKVVTNRGTVNADQRVVAVEGFSYELREQRRRVLPLQSRIIATEPLSDAQWQDIGLENREVFCDASPVITYGQRSVDNRLVFGARGSYRYGGVPRSDFSGDGKAFEQVHQLLLDCLPQLRGVAITHKWGGTLGVARSGRAHVVVDESRGLSLAGGYGGEGVGAANLMARSLVARMLNPEHELATMPWCHSGDPSRVLRSWEPEPLRWLGYRSINSALSLEEHVLRSGWPRWLRRPVQWVSAALQKLLN